MFPCFLFLSQAQVTDKYVASDRSSHSFRKLQVGLGSLPVVLSHIELNRLLRAIQMFWRRCESAPGIALEALSF